MKAQVRFSLLGLSLGRFSLAIIALSLFGCTATVDVDKNKLGPKPVSCVKGTRINCPCPDGTISTQTCNAYLRYDQCGCRSQFGASGTGG